jgi:hypothetical protein
MWVSSTEYFAPLLLQNPHHAIATKHLKEDYMFKIFEFFFLPNSRQKYKIEDWNRRHLRSIKTPLIGMQIDTRAGARPEHFVQCLLRNFTATLTNAVFFISTDNPQEVLSVLRTLLPQNKLITYNNLVFNPTPVEVIQFKANQMFRFCYRRCWHSSVKPYSWVSVMRY